MERCQWGNCTNAATHRASRVMQNATPRNPGELSVEVESIEVCEDHVEEARKEYDSVNPI